MSVRAFRSRRWLAYALSLFVLGAAAWTPASVYSQALPGGGQMGPSSSGATYPVSDEVFKVCDNGDNTKCAELENTGITTANTIPITLTNTAAVAGVRFGTGAFSLNPSGTRAHLFVDNEYRMGVVALTFADGDPVVVAGDAGLKRGAPNVLVPTKGDLATGPGWIQMQAGDDMLAADFTSLDAIVANTALNVTLAARKYTFKMVLFFSNSTAADGIRVDFNGGTATVTNFRVHCLVHDTALLLSQQSTALDTDIVATTATGASQMECNGTFEPLAGGTFIVRAAEEADGGGTLTVTRGSYIAFKDMP